MSKYIFKTMETDDEIRGKAYIHYKSWQETYTGLIDDEFLNSRTLQKCEEQAFRWRDNLIVAKDGDKVIGFSGYGAYRDDTLSDCGEVNSIYVLKEYQGQKVGYGLMNEALKRLSDYPQIALWVLKGNDKAIRFYERYGYSFDGAEKEIMLGTPSTELRMIYRRK